MTNEEVFYDRGYHMPADTSKDEEEKKLVEERKRYFAKLPKNRWNKPINTIRGKAEER